MNSDILTQLYNVAFTGIMLDKVNPVLLSLMGKVVRVVVAPKYYPVDGVLERFGENFKVKDFDFHAGSILLIEQESEQIYIIVDSTGFFSNSFDS